MLQTTHSERQYAAATAERARDDKMAAQACNSILTLTQANVLKLAIDALPELAIALAEEAFETYGWPDDRLDTAWLDDAGRVTWELFRAYRAAGRSGRAA